MTRFKLPTYPFIERRRHVLIFMAILTLTSASSQQTELDIRFRSYLRTIRNSIIDYFQTNEDEESLMEHNRNLGKLQEEIPRTVPFFCDTYGPGRRSIYPPSSVHKLRPGDIDIVAALGDSISSGNGITVSSRTEVLGLFVENKGVVFSIGGDLTWREYLTLPNILKEFNENLYGYSFGYATSYQHNARFNVAEPMGMSQDMKFQAEILYKRMVSDPNVNMTHHWKLVTIFTGHNNMCGPMCHQKNHTQFIDDHRRDLLKVLRYLRDTIPRLVVNYVPFANLKELFKFKGTPFLCDLFNRVECPCFFRSGLSIADQLLYSWIMKKWVDVDYEVINRPEFHDKEDFAVILQPFSINAKLPVNEDGTIDLRYLASDCFHFSQRGQARMANALWNNMMQPEGQKMDSLSPEFQYFECPTERRPYIATRRNSILYT